MNGTTEIASGTAAREIVTTRLLDAPRELVFEAWTNPEHVARWWGPRGFTTTIHQMDVRPGGVWKFIMHGPDGVDYKNRIVFIEVVRPERLVYHHGEDEENTAEDFHVTVTFEDRDGRTNLTLRALFATEEICETKKGFGAVEGGAQTLECLAEYLPTIS